MLDLSNDLRELRWSHKDIPSPYDFVSRGLLWVSPQLYRTGGLANQPIFPTKLADPFFGSNDMDPQRDGSMSLLPHTVSAYVVVRSLSSCGIG
jgi:hypothetical protein